ncbi:MAG: ribose-phosphate pyrophosphokinase-like domain-containing protein, partial [Bacteroidota bacterium]
MTPTSNEVNLFAINQTKELAEKIARSYGQELGKVEVARFSDGEMQPVIQQSVRGSYVFLIGST